MGTGNNLVHVANNLNVIQRLEIEAMLIIFMQN
jgi:hypothetical protein